MKLDIDLIKKLPKNDLHVHLDGSLRLNTLIELAKERNIELPSYTEEGLRELVFKNSYNSLTEYLEGFKYTVAVMQDRESLKRIAYEFMEDNIREGVRYVEVRFAPQLHINDDLELEDVIIAVNDGMKEACDKYNRNLPLDEPEYKYGIIVCAMRKFESFFSKYYEKFCSVHKFSKSKELYSLASLELAKGAVYARDKFSIPIVGFDLAGDEVGNPAIDHREAYSFVHRNFMKKTVHAGEAFGPESIFQAISELHADRIGHGYYLFDETAITDNKIEDKAKFVKALIQYIADSRITIEVCLTSNLQTNPAIGDLKNHNFRKMLEHRLSVAICTDNRLVSNTTVSKEILLAIENFDIDFKTLKDILIYGFKRSFFPGKYTEKRKYVRKVLNYIKKVGNGEE